MARSNQEAKEQREPRRESARTENLPAENPTAARLVTIIDPSNPASEAYRTLRTNLLYSQVDTPPKVIVMTSPGKGEGKS